MSEEFPRECRTFSTASDMTDEQWALVESRMETAFAKALFEAERLADSDTESEGPTFVYEIAEEAVYQITIDLPEGMDPNSEEAKEIAESEFCGLADPDDKCFLSVGERNVTFVAKG